MAEQIKSWPKTERPRERLIREGPRNLTDAELLAIILRVGRGTFKTGVQGETALSLSRKLLIRYRGLKGLDRAEISEMLKVEGVSVAKVAQIKAALELGKRTQSLSNKPRQFETAAEVFRFIEPRFAGARNEIAVALYLDGQNHLLEDRVIAEGVPTQSTIYLRRVLEGALAASASGVVLIHNHPSGEPEPSTDDDQTTFELEKGARLLGLVLTDHIIIGDGKYYSYTESGRLQHNE
jgi:DNA repair protein RadC